LTKWIEETISGSKSVQERKTGQASQKNEKRGHSHLLGIIKDSAEIF